MNERMAQSRRRLNILTWHVHGNYLYNLTQAPHDFWLVVDAERSTHRTGRNGSLPWGPNVHEVRVEELRSIRFDLVLYQSRQAWEYDRLELLSEQQRTLPRIVLEHDPPQESPSNTRHWCNDPHALLVHVTPYNALMWDNGNTPVRIIEHGVALLGQAPWSGEIPQGLVVVNNIQRRGRRLGLDIWKRMSDEIPLCLVGMGSVEAGGMGEIPQQKLPQLMASHRFFFNPIRHTSLGLAVIEAMMVGLPVVGLATTELVTVIDSGRNGFIDTRLERLSAAMRQLIKEPGLAREWGEAGRLTAMERFSIDRFVEDWNRAFHLVTS